jgi:NADPH-dependent curcumin reductase CurA
VWAKRIIINLNILAIGCKVIGAAGSEEKRRIVKEKGGADEVIDYNKDGWQVSDVSDSRTRVLEYSSCLDHFN